MVSDDIKSIILIIGVIFLFAVFIASVATYKISTHQPDNQCIEEVKNETL